MAEEAPKPEKLAQVDYRPPGRDWRGPAAGLRQGTFCYRGPPKHLEYLGLPNPRPWQPSDADWKLPADWKQIILAGMKDRLGRFRLFRPFVVILLWGGACADKC